MNKNILAVFAVAALTLTACKKEATATETNVDTTAIATVNDTVSVAGTSFTIAPADSKVEWEGGKVTGDKHLGTINIKEGNLVTNGGKLVDGKVVFDMASIVSTDLTDPEMKAKLEGHLKGLNEEGKDDFFNTNTYPTATLDITRVYEEYGKTMVEGNFDMKGKSDVVKFPVTVTETADAVTLVTDQFTIDRTKWGVNYGSGTAIENLAADKVIKDDVILKASVTAKK